MKIVAITVCVNYADYLAVTLKNNSALVDVVYVITTPEDMDTKEVCKEYSNVTMIEYADLNLNGAVFNKSGMVHTVQQEAHDKHPESWVVLLDADVVLPSNFREIAEAECTDKESLYGMARVDYACQADLDNKRNGRKFTWGLQEKVFAGYFQMYFDKSKLYEDWSKDCSSCDIGFANQFGTKAILLSGEVSHTGPTQRNWQGRVTPQWS